MWRDHRKNSYESIEAFLRLYRLYPRTNVSEDMQTRFSEQLAFDKFLSKIKGIFNTVPVSWIQHTLRNFPFILDRNLEKANCTENRVCTSCDIVVIGYNLWVYRKHSRSQRVIRYQLWNCTITICVITVKYTYT